VADQTGEGLVPGNLEPVASSHRRRWSSSRPTRPRKSADTARQLASRDLERLPIWSTRAQVRHRAPHSRACIPYRGERGRRLELRASLGVVPKHQGSWHLPHAPGPRAAHPRPAGARSRRAGCQRHALAVPFRAQARGSHNRMCPAANLGRRRPRPPGSDRPGVSGGPLDSPGRANRRDAPAHWQSRAQATCTVHRSPRSVAAEEGIPELRLPTITADSAPQAAGSATCGP
jgi:hypothetical protein